MQISLFRFLKDHSAFCEILERIKVKEKNFWKQNQSPDTPKILVWLEFNSNYLGRSELIYLCFFCYFCKELKRKPRITWYLLESLPEKLFKAEFLSSAERIQLSRLVQKSGEKVFLDQCNPFSPRGLLGILGSHETARKVLSRTYQRRRQAKLARQDRIRGYRDHGTLPKSHLWLPSRDFSLTEEQNRLEEKKREREMLRQFSLSGEFTHFLNHLNRS